MKSRLRQCAALGFLALSAFACDPAAADGASGELLWEIEYGGASVASVFGTVHSRGLEDARRFHPRALARFDTSAVLYVETDVSAVDQARYSERALLDSGAPGLDTQLTAAEWEQLSLATRDLLPVETLRRARPWYAAQLFLGSSVPSRLASGVAPMDLALVDEARARGAEVRFLEDWTEQVFAVSVTTGVEQLKASLALGAAELERSQRALETEWEQGDVGALGARLGELNAEQRRFLFEERNDRWASVIERALLEGDRKLFVAVGALHLMPGAKGLPGLLRERRIAVARSP